MSDGSHEVHVPLSAEALDEARADPRPVDLVEALAALRDKNPPPGTDE